MKVRVNYWYELELPTERVLFSRGRFWKNDQGLYKFSQEELVTNHPYSGIQMKVLKEIHEWGTLEEAILFIRQTHPVRDFF